MNDITTCSSLLQTVAYSIPAYTGPFAILRHSFPFSLLATDGGRVGTSPVLAQKLCTKCFLFLFSGFLVKSKRTRDDTGSLRTSLRGGLILIEDPRSFGLFPICLFVYVTVLVSSNPFLSPYLSLRVKDRMYDWRRLLNVRRRHFCGHPPLRKPGAASMGLNSVFSYG